MPRHASTDPTARMGVYTRLGDVPDQHRLRNYRAQYAGRDVWQAYVDSRPDTYDSTHYRNTLSKAGTAWKKHMSARRRHHALARPADVESWLRELTETRTLSTVYSEYWVRLEECYAWLLFHTDHPHVYHPPLLAVVAGGTARQLWDHKFGADARDAATGGARR